jgi:hypothetical protein
MRSCRALQLVFFAAPAACKGSTFGFAEGILEDDFVASEAK